MNHTIEVGTCSLLLCSRETTLEVIERPVFYYRNKHKYIQEILRLGTKTGQPITNGPPQNKRLNSFEEQICSRMLSHKTDHSLGFLHRTRGE